MKAQMREAGRCGAKYCIILGENEKKEQKAIVKNMESGDQSQIPFAELTNYFSIA